MIFYFLDSFVNIFVGGRSLFKLVAFLAYLLILTAIAVLLFRQKKRCYSWWYFFGVLLAVYLYNLFLEISYTISHQTGFGDYLIIGRNGSFSSSSLFHTHIAKGVIGQFFSWFNLPNLPGTDLGKAFIGSFPSWIFGFGFLLLVVLVVMAIFYFITSWCNILQQKNLRQKIILVITYAIASFSLIESSIDGGILSRANLVALCFIPLFILNEKGKRTTVYYWCLAIFGFIFLSASLWPVSLDYSQLNEIYATGALILLYSLLFYIYKLDQPYYRYRWLLLVLIIGFSGAWWLSSWRLRDIYDYAMTPLSAGQTVYYYNESQAAVNSMIVEQATTIGRLAAQQQKNISYRPLTVAETVCYSDDQDITLNNILISKKPLPDTLRVSTGVRLSKIKETFKNGWYQTTIIFYINPCTPEPYAVINSFLLNNNLTEYTLAMPYF